MLDPLVLAVIIVVISAVGAVFFFMSGPNTSGPKKKAVKPQSTPSVQTEADDEPVKPQQSEPVAESTIPISPAPTSAFNDDRDDQDDVADAVLQQIQVFEPEVVTPEPEVEPQEVPMPAPAQPEAERDVEIPPVEVDLAVSSEMAAEDEERSSSTSALEPAKVTEAEWLVPAVEEELVVTMNEIEASAANITVQSNHAEEPNTVPESASSEANPEQLQTSLDSAGDDESAEVPAAHALLELHEVSESEEEVAGEQAEDDEVEPEERVSTDQDEDTEFIDPSPRPSEDAGEGRGSLTLDTSPLPRTPTSHSSSRPNSLQRHDAARAHSPMRSPPPGSARANPLFGSNYSKKGTDSWIRNASNTGESAAAASPVSVTPSRHSVPKKLIPLSDDQQPLALRQGQKINQYESGLQAEREKVSSRVKETRQKNITDVVARVLLAGDTSQVPDQIDMTQLLADPNAEITKRTIVKQMTVKFNAPAPGTPGATSAAGVLSPSGGAGAGSSAGGADVAGSPGEGVGGESPQGASSAAEATSADASSP